MNLELNEGNKRKKIMNRLSGKVAIVTGSTNGIGLAIARRLGREGASVVVSSRKAQNVDETVTKLRKEGLSIVGAVCNVAKEEQRLSLLQTALDKFGKIDILVSNAGINPHFGSLLDVSESVWDKLFETNVKAGFLLSKMVVPYMQKAGGGNIVYVSSIAGFAPMPGIMAYGVTKTALLGLTRAMAETLASSNIRVNCIAPGIIKTDFSRAVNSPVSRTRQGHFYSFELWETEESKEAKAAKAMVPLGRLGTSEDCGATVAFLVSEDAAYVTGETLPVTGGVRAHL